MTLAVLDRLADAINQHDIDALTACFAPDFENVWPAHPARSFTGRDQVRRNWEMIFRHRPDIAATISAQDLRRPHHSERELADAKPDPPFIGHTQNGSEGARTLALVG